MSRQKQVQVKLPQVKYAYFTDGSGTHSELCKALAEAITIARDNGVCQILVSTVNSYELAVYVHNIAQSLKVEGEELKTLAEPCNEENCPDACKVTVTSTSVE